MTTPWPRDSSTRSSANASAARLTARATRRRDVFDYIKIFYNLTPKHTHSGMLSPIEFERQHKAKPRAFRKLGAIPSKEKPRNVTAT